MSMEIGKRQFFGTLIAGICCVQAKSEESLGSSKGYRILFPSISEEERIWIDMTLSDLDLCGLQFSKAGLIKSKFPAVVLRLINIEWKKGTTEIFLLDIPRLVADTRAKKSFTSRYNEGDISIYTTKSKMFLLNSDSLTVMQEILQKLELKPSGIENGFEMNHNNDNTIIIEILLPESFKIFMMDNYKRLETMSDIVSKIKQMCVVNPTR